MALQHRDPISPPCCQHLTGIVQVMPNLRDLSDKELEKLHDRRAAAHYATVVEQNRRKRIKDYGSEDFGILNGYEMHVFMNFPVSVYAKSAEEAENIALEHIYPYDEHSQIVHRDSPVIEIEDIELGEPGETDSNKRTIAGLRAAMGEAV